VSEQSRNPTALAFSPQRGLSRRKRQKTGREPILPENDRKPFRMISLRKIRQQLPWIDILTKNTGGWGYIPFSQPMTPPVLDRVVKTCLAKEPDERWQTATDLCRELRWIANGGSLAVLMAAAVNSKGANFEIGTIWFTRKGLRCIRVRPSRGQNQNPGSSDDE
jgi:hypothetical protein